MPMKKTLLIISLLLFFNFFVLKLFAQVKTLFSSKERISFQGKFRKDFNPNQTFVIPSIDSQSIIEKEMRENKTSNEPKPYRIAEPIKVSIDVLKEAQWLEDLEYGFGNFVLVASKAKSISLNFDQFYLPSGTELYIYNKNGEIITGPITSSENNVEELWGSWIYPGEMVIIDFRVPLNVKSEMKLHISNIAYGYKEVFGEMVNDFNGSSFCNINVLCSQGNGWENERNSVALILSSDGSALCSGGLINNAANYNIPYLLTANHCYAANSNVSSWRFTFQAWSPTCTPTQNSVGLTFNGATLKSRHSSTDFCLLQLNQVPPTNSGLVYSGWSKSSVPTSSGVSITHPRGDVMKIAVFNQSPTQQLFLNSKDWKVIWANGTVEPGSSGGPLFNNKKQIIGQVHGGDVNNICTGNDHAYFGRFDLSWTGGGTSTTRLRNWLDPTNSGKMEISARGIPSIVTSASEPLCLNSTFTIENLAQASNVIWSSSNPSAFSINNISGVGTRLNDFNGMITITASISGSSGPNTLIRTVWVGAPSTPGIVYGNSNPTYGTTQFYNFLTPSTGFVNFYDWETPPIPLCPPPPPNSIFGPCTQWNTLVDENTQNLSVLVGNTNGFIQVRAVNQCGPGLYSSLFVNVANVNSVYCPCGYINGQGVPMAAKIYPNPSTSEINIDFNQEEFSNSETEIEFINSYEIELQNEKLERVLYEKTKRKSLKIQTEFLQSGTYYITIRNETGNYVYRIIIRH